MICPSCKKEYIVYLKKIDYACILVWSKCVRCLINKKEKGVKC